MTKCAVRCAARRRAQARSRRADWHEVSFVAAAAADSAAVAVDDSAAAGYGQVTAVIGECGLTGKKGRLMMMMISVRELEEAGIKIRGGIEFK